MILWEKMTLTLSALLSGIAHASVHSVNASANTTMVVIPRGAFCRSSIRSMNSTSSGKSTVVGSSSFCFSRGPKFWQFLRDLTQWSTSLPMIGHHPTSRIAARVVSAATCPPLRHEPSAVHHPPHSPPHTPSPRCRHPDGRALGTHTIRICTRVASLSSPLPGRPA